MQYYILFAINLKNNIYFRKYMIVQTILTVVKCYLVSTGAPLTKIDIKQRLHN